MLFLLRPRELSSPRDPICRVKLKQSEKKNKKKERKKELNLDIVFRVKVARWQSETLCLGEVLRPE